MKTIIPTIGIRGDVQPYIALSVGLKRAGHAVTLASHPSMKKQVESYEVPFAPMSPTGITSPTLNLIPLSPQIFPPNSLWEARHRMTGYWFAPSPQSWTSPDDLVAFLKAGEPPVVVSLGAIALSGEDTLQAAQINLAAVQHAGVRAIIQGWAELLEQLSIPPSVIHAGSIRHDWLLAQFPAGYFFNDALKSVMGWVLLFIDTFLPFSVYVDYANDATY